MAIASEHALGQGKSALIEGRRSNNSVSLEKSSAEGGLLAKLSSRRAARASFFPSAQHGICSISSSMGVCCSYGRTAMTCPPCGATMWGLSSTMQQRLESPHTRRRSFTKCPVAGWTAVACFRLRTTSMDPAGIPLTSSRQPTRYVTHPDESLAAVNTIKWSSLCSALSWVPRRSSSMAPGRRAPERSSPHTTERGGGEFVRCKCMPYRRLANWKYPVVSSLSSTKTRLPSVETSGTGAGKSSMTRIGCRASLSKGI
mmetsp:Transcript_55953/g.104925  ORF Transcript_55953/g.104925 Transcript_55953/m.104925 type:complete len:257 (-) Transcript_55953:569-1339(-)